MKAKIDYSKRRNRYLKQKLEWHMYVKRMYLQALMLLLSVSAYGQIDKSKADTTQWFTVGKWDNSITWNSNQSDTVAVYMLVAKKVTHDYPLELRQIKGYSVTPRTAYNSLPFATYLDNNKKPMPDNYIVWMSVKR